MGVRLIDLIKTLSLGMDLISSALRNHHVRVGFLASALSSQLGLSAEIQRDLLIAGLLHDAGALSYRSRIDALEFETDGRVHSEAGFKLVKPYPRFSNVALYIRHHHDKYSYISGQYSSAPQESNILSVSDRIDVLIDRNFSITGQLEGIRSKIRKKSGTHFNPDYVEAFCDLSLDQEFVIQLEDPQSNLQTFDPSHLENELLDHYELLDYTRLFSKVIDFRSSFTATHSRGVAETSSALARLLGFSENECDYLKIAGNLHDLGKLAVPESILEKAGPLKDQEWTIMRTHPEQCRKILEEVPSLTKIKEWACNHHERLDGKGYPRGLTDNDLSIECQILAVADVFTAITEDRPYRDGMPLDIARTVLRDMSVSSLRSDIIGVLLHNFDEIDRIRKISQSNARKEFYELYES